MIKKLTKYGNSLALIVDKPILDLLKIDQTTELEISTDGTNIIIVPLHKVLGKVSNDARVPPMPRLGASIKKIKGSV